MSLLVVMAHFDFERRLREHTLRTLEALSADSDRVVVVSTSGLREQDLARLPPRVEFIARANYGYDFYSYKWALDAVGNFGDFDRLVICNDSFVGPLVPLRDVVDSTQARSCDLMGMTYSHHHGGHVQSFFMSVNSHVARSRAFRRFWQDMEPVTNRMDVIHKYEIGFSRAIENAGFTLGSYFQPSEEEEVLAQDRYLWFREHRIDATYPDKVLAELHPFVPGSKPWNPAVAYADRVLDNNRLPLLKFDTLRFDPYELGSRRLLTACEERKPEAFRGVSSFLEATKSRYPFRRGEVNRPASEEKQQSQAVGYLLDRATTRNEGC
ncbi:rhamnan synthesis F family protein [Zhihengliuella flava]|uniref:Rhamnosyltransferase n=1 Tax=Zhihengliuella flava TaxID=1285193 RepID=A0A931D9T7_9MICC|nr:rhamnan synthesis F family protein [Zhihengliuella flava]MBG6083551.1 rhamnosyltransferase [Zhihengliuella flava]